MHWCADINALQRPFLLTTSCCLCLTRRVCFLCEIPYLFCYAGDSRPSLLFNSGQQHRRKGACKRRMNRVWLHISTPPPGSLMSAKLPPSIILHLVTIRIRCAIKLLFVIYLHTDRETLFKSNPCFQAFPDESYLVCDRRCFVCFFF